MNERHQSNHDKLDACLVQIQGISNMLAKSKLWKFYNNCRTCWTEMDREFVNCRRAKKVTLKYTELEAQFVECIHTFEQWTIMAALSY